MKQVAFERAAEYRKTSNLWPLSWAVEKVLILVEDNDGRTSEIDAVHWPHLGWTDAVTLLKVEEEVLGWCPLPFRRQPPPVDMTGWTDEQVTAEVERRFGDMQPAARPKSNISKQGGWLTQRRGVLNA